MENKCKDCGICCLNTDMILSEQDINLILKNYPLNNLQQEYFIFINKNGLYQLKNVEDHCFFFDTTFKKCKIYHYHPQGCRFYPLIYDIDKKKCVLDKDCPRTHLFYQNKYKIKGYCKKIKNFIRGQLHINI